jgi:hypothetical protein
VQALWTCPKCGRAFANRNQFHFCSNVRLDDHFAGRDPEVVATFHALLEAAEKSGPVKVLPEKTRIDVISPRNQVHVFRLREPSEVDGEVERWLHEAYSVGEQKHLKPRVR